MRRSIATPCPVVASQSRLIDETHTEDTTTNLEYTTAFHASFRNVRPRRVQLTRRETTNFAIHEDADVVDAPDARRTGEQPPGLSHAAKRVIGQKRTEQGSRRITNQDAKTKVSGLVQNVKARRPLIAPKPEATNGTAISDDLLEENKHTPKARNNVERRPTRRKTLYIPSDDTTQPTMWMGIFSPIKNEIDHSLDGNGSDPVELTGIAAQMAEKRRRTTSAHHARAKRLPLHHNPTIQAQACEVPDRAGASTGKENLPPGQTRQRKQVSTVTTKEIKENQKIDRDLQRTNFIAQARIDKVLRSKNQSSPSSPKIHTMYEIGQDEDKANTERPKRVAWNAGPRAILKDERVSKKQRNTERSSPISHVSSQPLPTNVPTRFVQPPLQKTPTHVPYVPIVEHIEHPELYEDDWLGQQEIAITQLLNSILSQAQENNNNQNKPHDDARSKLLSRYNSQDIRLLYSRVQAACLYGALSPTHEAIFQIQNLVNDVGRRKLFLKFWVDNYNAEMLTIALEVISGRQVVATTARRSSGASPANTLKRQSLADFIASFILRHEDCQFKTAGSGVAEDLGGKTILKSLMLLKALDLLKEGSDEIEKGLLFRKNACFKSSTIAIQTLMQMLNPAVGDPIRALRQLGYLVLHQQEPVDEVRCRIENIAVDLRDGVCLTRLAEVLLYRSQSSHHGNTTQPENATITMTDGQLLSYLVYEDLPLSQYLKIPCSSRAAKLWNVDIALGALRNVKNIGGLIEDISPEDIVNGYREKTIKLLWTLIGRWGLTGFIDRNDLRNEIKRLNRRTVFNEDLEEDDSANHQVESETLLKRWTESVASSRGLQVRNYTTSFSDGRIFEAILDEYEPYLVKNEAIKAGPLHERLNRLGCSRQFSNLFSSNNGKVHIFGKDFVLGALAFLCSRVVGPSKLCRSAIGIQRCWRKHWHELQQARRVVKRDLAEACVASVCLRMGQAADDKILTPADPDDMTTEVTAKSEIDEDIWLSL